MEECNRIVQEYFDDFVEAFLTFDGQRVAEKFAVPFMAKGQAGQGTVFSSLSDIGDYFQTWLDEYKSKGCVRCCYDNLEVKWLGSQCPVASVDWMLLDSEGSAVISWSESYLLTISGDKALAFATIDHGDA